MKENPSPLRVKEICASLLLPSSLLEPAAQPSNSLLSMQWIEPLVAESLKHCIEQKATAVMNVAPTHSPSPRLTPRRTVLQSGKVISRVKAQAAAQGPFLPFRIERYSDADLDYKAQWPGTRNETAPLSPILKQRPDEIEIDGSDS